MHAPRLPYQRIRRFAIVGLSAYAIDLGVFNLLAHAGTQSPLADKPLTAKAVSALIATTYAFISNRNWTYNDTLNVAGKIGSRRNQYLAFVTVNIAAAAVAVACLAVSRYGLGLDTALADNISANVVGLLIGTVLRYWAYSTWVFAARVRPGRSSGEPCTP